MSTKRYRWPDEPPNTELVRYAEMNDLIVGVVLGLMIGLCIGVLIA